MNAGKRPLIVLDLDCLTISNRVVQEVEAAGLETRRTFDLDIVRSGNPQFQCPIHGSNDCTCQLVILLVMMRYGRSVTVILEGRDHQTWVYLDEGHAAADEEVDPRLTGALSQAFFPKSILNL